MGLQGVNVRQHLCLGFVCVLFTDTTPVPNTSNYLTLSRYLNTTYQIGLK